MTVLGSIKEQLPLQGGISHTKSRNLRYFGKEGDQTESELVADHFKCISQAAQMNGQIHKTWHGCIYIYLHSILILSSIYLY